MLLKSQTSAPDQGPGAPSADRGTLPDRAALIDAAPTLHRNQSGSPAKGLTWARLLTLAAVGALVVLLASTLIHRDQLAPALAGIVALGLGLGMLRRRGRRLGAIVHGLVFADIAWYTLSATISHLLTHATVQALVLPALLAVISTTGLVAAAATLLPSPARGSVGAGARIVALAAVGVFVLTLGAGYFYGEPEYQGPADLVLVTEGMAYSSIALEADGPQVTLQLANRDLFWHTFSVDALGVDLKVPVNGQRAVTFAAEPGTYAFYCSVPSHARLGMQGTLTIDGPRQAEGLMPEGWRPAATPRPGPAQSPGR